VRHFGTTGKSGMGDMRALPDGRKSTRTGQIGAHRVSANRDRATLGILQVNLDGALARRHDGIRNIDACLLDERFYSLARITVTALSPQFP
jgi:hypothetical protein